MTNRTSADGRELMVQFTCRRCKAKTILSYDSVMIGETYGYLHNSILPKGWDNIGYSSIVCEECAKAYKEFMSPVQAEKEIE